jgi:hypothetical protein
LAAVADSNDAIGSNNNDAIGGSISLVHGSKQQSTDARGEEMATTTQQLVGDVGGETQQSASR